MKASLQPLISDAALAIDIAHVTKSYGATRAIDDVSFSIRQGGSHALLGENGAGKSTLVKLLSGLVSPDSGSIRLFGEEASLRSPRHSHALGIQTAYQEMTHVKDLSVLDNMLLPYGAVNPLGMMRRRQARDQIGNGLSELGLGDIALDEEVQHLELAVRQKLEIARAVMRKPRVLLLDESTSTLSGSDVDWLGDLIVKQRASGVTVVFISHRLSEVRAFCDTVTVLRGGKHIATSASADFSDGDIIGMIAGREMAHAFPRRRAARSAGGAEVLGAVDLSTSGKLRNASFSLHAGEILGVAGLQGMGQLDLFLACFGMADVTGGTLQLDGRPAAILSPAEAVKAGISLVPEDRKTEGLFLELSGRHNASMPVLDRFRRGMLIDTQLEEETVGRVLDRMEIDRRALWTRAGAFSGGNQQKIAIAKWLLAESRVLLLYDPTRGIDVGTKNQIYRLMRDYADAGGAVLFYSTEIPELVHLADRAMVFYGGGIAAEIAAADLSEEALLRAALGSPAAHLELAA
ncbi:sugar ABC transporter ATP-binding protein [Variovorax ginsengisoli]|uniref:Ribose transport system ATP-binding protein n=1 Tax=Variovorax ginsengisoli TaxID=363844 RepID=A0ABT9S4P4_9BURK|nr:sugar ABC transporter ATP-binding protein [Variovorax ginsengisoli]MDP9899316.1 ribose transport system ATP-binding protein [Variovorax ginsengisoli]